MWLVLVLAFLVVVEFIRDNIERQASLNAMTDDEVRTLFAARKVFMRPAMAGASAGGASSRSASGVPSRTSALDEKDSAELDALMAELLSRGSKEVVGRHAHGKTAQGEGAGAAGTSAAGAGKPAGAPGADAASMADEFPKEEVNHQVVEGSSSSNNDKGPIGAHAIPGSDSAPVGAHAAPDADKASTGAHAAVRKGKAELGAHVAPDDAGDGSAAGGSAIRNDTAAYGFASAPEPASESEENGEVR